MQRLRYLRELVRLEVPFGRHVDGKPVQGFGEVPMGNDLFAECLDFALATQLYYGDVEDALSFFAEGAGDQAESIEVGMGLRR